MLSSSTATEPAPPTAARDAKHGIIDSDIHQSFVDGLNDLVPYLPKAWARKLTGAPSQYNGFTGDQYYIPTQYLYPNMAGAFRGDAVFDGLPPAADAAHTARHHLDANGITRGLLVSGSLLGLGSFPNPEVAAAVASAHNDWMAERWLEVDSRYRGAIIVPPQHPEAAVEEIKRNANRPGMAAVFLPLWELLWGERHYWPIFAEAERHELAVVTHVSGTESTFARAPKMAGVPTFYIEWHAALSQIHFSNVVSLVCHGVFEKFPKLKVVCIEGGFMWLAELMWRLDRDWEGLRIEVPWVKRPPSEYVLEHVWCTTQPFVEPPKRQQVVEALDMVCAPQTLIFSSDYPHWDFDDPHRALAAMPPEARRRAMWDAPLEIYGDRMR